ncbi:glycosyltransferase family 2 protein [Phenylobacterium sp.]|uniref:glycosyltransferase family 2 protein n=1 Tax=Phenylobacterium sp. TaxID=1871053 RepID=UPI0035AD93B4
MPAVTVAIPAFKPAYLSQAIASVLAQSFGDFELLISDDCAGDEVKTVVGGFRDPRIRLIEGPRQGLVPNSVHLWENAAGDMLKYVYDDDFLLPFCLAELTTALSQASDANFAFCFRHIVDDAGLVTASPRAFAGDQLRAFDRGVVARWITRHLMNPLGEPTNLLIRRSAFASARCLDSFAGQRVRHLIDVCFYLNASREGGCVGVPAFHAAFRRHAAQVTSSQTAPGFSFGLLEWELFLRGAVEAALVTPQEALAAMPRMDQLYRSFERGFPELARRRAKLPELRTALAGGETQLLTHDFLSDLKWAEELVASRKAAHPG